MDNFTILVWMIVLIFMAGLILWPHYGLLAAWREHQKQVERERIEDALKYLLGRQHEGHFTSPESLAGALRLSNRTLLRLINKLLTQGLVQNRERELALTPEGQLWALRVVRAHRLWERYLADEARLPLEQIHSEAHHHEHNMSQVQVDELDAALGHPISDPHGDPIPDRSGNFREQQDVKPLSDWPVGEPGQIAHLEDEPPLAYSQILAVGLRLGQVVRILEVGHTRVVLADEEHEYVLAPAVAENVFLRPLPQVEQIPQGALTLADLAPGKKAQILTLDSTCQGFTRRRFLDLGLTPGTRIAPELENSFGDPRAYRVRGTLIALRREQSCLVWVMPEQV
jgi:DtxR family transcriptional regulator, Mn-dependent transcriptional regulator